ncbi:protein CHROMATIN REMODELING 24 [Sesamum angolense]|uniref:Protein CHROMATIN REMODELING 24 n=1 Tax=Sesamum angolense TaxID=2727404 RepID=A0AAE2C6S3_9LAMI|nr:protein CHROMATIN REMODELING 24 [Sesamum angolense]
MADGKKKHAMSLNQLHNRFLNDLSASHSKPKPSAAVEDNTQWKVKAVESTEGNDDVPRFDFDITSPSPLQEREVNVDEEPVSTKIKDSSPQLFAGIADFDSPSPVLSSILKVSRPDCSSSFEVIFSKASEPRESSKSTEDGGSSCEANPTISGSSEYSTNLSVGMKLEHIGLESTKVSDIEDNASKKKSLLSGGVDHASNFRGEERQTKVKIEGRRRLCRISKNNDSESEAGRNSIRDEEPKFDGISDFDSPPQVNKTCETAGNEIRDILNDLSARLEILSIEKKRVPKKGVPEYHNAASSYRLSSDSLDNTIESKVGSILTSELQKEKTSISTGKDDTCVGKANRTLYKFEGLNNDELMRAHVKSASTTESQAYNYSREVEGFDTGDYAAFSKKDIVKQVDRRQEKIIDVSDNESDEVTVLEDHVDYFTLSGPKLTYKLPGKLAKMLYPHQREGLKWLWSLHCKGKGGILGDDMGLGKTMQICSFIAGLFHSNLVRRVLVVAPKTLLAHWINELSTVGLSEKTREYFATCTKTRHYELQYVLQDKGVLLTTYDIVRNNVKSLCGDYHYNDDGDEDETTWDYMILDEEFRECIQPFFLRRLKSEVFHDDTTLSKKNEIIVWLRLTRCQRQLYEAFLKSEIVLSACDGSPLAALTILKKICDHPLLLTKRAAEDVLEGMNSIVDQEDHRVAERLAMHIADVAERFDIVENHDISCKISFILSLLGDLVPKGHNVLIFSQTRKMLNLIQESLISNHYKYIRIDGTTKASDRAKIVKDFQEGHGAPVFLLTTQVGGLGLTLTNADRVIVVDPAWNPSTDNQSVDRAYRIGQKKDVIVYRLMTCGTVEEKIYRKQVFKGGLFRSATEHKEQIRYFSQQDLRDLFSLPKQGFDVSPTQQQLLEEHDHQHTMEESLRAHVEFLETLSIAGISQHNLLFSKAAPLQAVEIEEEAGRLRGSRFMGNPPTRSSIEQNVDGAHYAFNPKDIKKIQKNSNPHVREPSEDEIRARISRLSQIFADKAAVSRLPDKGEKIHRQITSLNLQLDQLRMAKRNKEDVIEL